jgi:hypothetical protein
MGFSPLAAVIATVPSVRRRPGTAGSPRVRRSFCRRATSTSSLHYALTCLARHKNRRQIKKMPLTLTVFGVVPSVVDRWWSPKGLPLQKSNFVLHRCSLLPHETPLSNPHPARLSACSVSLRLNAQQNSILNFLSASSTLLSCPSPFPASSAPLYRTVSATLHTAVSSHSISIGPASAATPSGFLLAA